MRLLFTVLMASSVALASGCSGDDDAPTGGDTGTTTTGTTSTGTTTAGTTTTGDGTAGDGTTDGETTGETGGTTLGALDEMSLWMAEAICERIEDCFFDFPGLFEVTDCDSALHTTFRSGVIQQWVAAEETGNATVDLEAFQACIDSVAGASCSDLASLPGDCGTAVVGTVAEGEACTWDVECAGANFCRIDDACPGVCTAAKPADAACAEGDLCAEGLVCHGDACVAGAAKDAACGADQPPCVFGLLCAGLDEEADQAGTCIEFSSLQTQKDGESCDALAGQFCEPGLFCLVDAIDGDANVTWACGSAAATGGACRPGLPDPCPAGEICVAPDGELDGTCTTLPGAGEPCLKGGMVEGTPLLFCRQATACSSASQCEAVVLLGESCTEDLFCITGRCADGTCAPVDPCD
ncbi:MAG: hypothetical protein ACI9WU_004675 [Myxococcota bacterium]|jgi:hypothetical protein